MSPPDTILSATIYEAAARLGAVTDGDRPLPKSVKDCPAFVVEFYRRIIWPNRQEFAAPKMKLLGFNLICFGGLQAVPPEQRVLGAEGKDLIAFGNYDGGNWILAFDGQDEHPENPMVYDVDHEPGEALDELCKLSDFLAMLQPTS